MLKKVLRICSGMVSFLLGCICLVFFLAATQDLIVGDPETGRGVLAGLFVFFGMLSLGSFTATFLSFKPFIFGENSSSVEHEHRILNFAKASGGRVTVGEAALNCYLSVDSAKAAGFADPQDSRNHKFGSRRLKTLLASISSLLLDKQRERLLQAFSEHQGEEPQRDDVAFKPRLL